MNEVCSICLETISDKSVKVSCCNNEFHIICYLDAMKVKRICPLCRTVFEPSVVVETSNNLIVPIRTNTVTLFGNSSCIISSRIIALIFVVAIIGGICYALAASAFQ